MTELSLGAINPAASLSTAKSQGASAATTPGGAGDTGLPQSAATYSSPLLQSLNRKLTSLGQALANFSFPKNASPFADARLVVADSQTQGKLEAELSYGSENYPNYKFFSNGFELNVPSGIAAGNYELKLGQDSKTETLKVTVKEGESGKSVLDSLAKAINEGELKVRAEVVYANASFSLDPAQKSQGYVLAVSVNPELNGHSLTLDDTNGHLADTLGVVPTSQAATPASLGTYMVAVNQLARKSGNQSSALEPGAASSLSLGRHDIGISNGRGAQAVTYLSKELDPTAVSSLAPGTYNFSLRSNGETRNYSVSVQSGWTNGDVLRAVEANISGNPEFSEQSHTPISSQGFGIVGISANLESSPIASQTQAGVLTSGVALRLQSKDQDFSLSDTSGGLLANLGLTSKLSGQTVSFIVQPGDSNNDVLSSLATAVNSSPSALSAQTQLTLRPDYAISGKRLNSLRQVLSLVQNTERVGQKPGLSDGLGSPLQSLGLTNQAPGVDGKLSVNGKQTVSANNSYILDQGRLKLQAKAEYSPELPLSVTNNLQIIEDRLSDVINSYNDVVSFAYTNRANFDASLLKQLQAPVNANRSNLNWLGLSQFGRDKSLWLSANKFWSAFGANFEQVGKTLLNSGQALIPSLAKSVETIYANGLASYLAPGSLPVKNFDDLLSESDLLKKNRLIDLMG